MIQESFCLQQVEEDIMNAEGLTDRAFELEFVTAQQKFDQEG